MYCNIIDEEKKEPKKKQKLVVDKFPQYIIIIKMCT